MAGSEEFFEFCKVDQERRLVFGWGYVAINPDGRVRVDKQGDFIDNPDDLEIGVYDYVINSRRGDFMHIKKDTAVLVESIVFTPDKLEKMGIPLGVLPQLAWWAGYFVKDDGVWEEVKTGRLKGFSMGGSGIREDAEPNA